MPFSSMLGLCSSFWVGIFSFSNQTTEERIRGERTYISILIQILIFFKRIKYKKKKKKQLLEDKKFVAAYTK